MRGDEHVWWLRGASALLARRRRHGYNNTAPPPPEQRLTRLLPRSFARERPAHDTPVRAGEHACIDSRSRAGSAPLAVRCDHRAIVRDYVLTLTHTLKTDPGLAHFFRRHGHGSRRDSDFRAPLLLDYWRPTTRGARGPLRGDRARHRSSGASRRYSTWLLGSRARQNDFLPCVPRSACASR